ncbi:hypothetical protein BT96DRAFT_994332 [Gymnopus androsaceus JB14]|uniref:Uncharacterized protein n=1 Tax=Gymnopus androsaceus JB14 TaxID=1447944 RepID=A0A6A4HLV7_9AGAR|nr:hypothetical protein BT96DRAFT_994332 [Gymnopus androsaceus JB14]
MSTPTISARGVTVVASASADGGDATVVATAGVSDGEGPDNGLTSYTAPQHPTSVSNTASSQVVSLRVLPRRTQLQMKIQGSTNDDICSITSRYHYNELLFHYSNFIFNSKFVALSRYIIGLYSKLPAPHRQLPLEVPHHLLPLLQDSISCGYRRRCSWIIDCATGNWNMYPPQPAPPSTSTPSDKKPNHTFGRMPRCRRGSLQPLRLGHQPQGILPAPIPSLESSEQSLSEQLESPEGNDVRSQVTSLQNSNAEMRTAIVRLTEYAIS